MWASSCWKRRTLVRPVSVPDSSFLWRTPKSANLRGSSLHERGLWLNMRLQDNRRAGKSIVTRHKYCMCRFIYYVYRLILTVPVPGAVHGLECEDIFFHREGEHVFTVVLPVARCFPQFAVIDVRRGHFLKASSPVLLLEKETPTKPNKQAKSARWSAQVLYWGELHPDFRLKTGATAVEIRSYKQNIW